ncbi:hypothetical protein [Endozoicomonas sp. ISHI1]|uniref:hypothetical protein n=2 Tax=unclassified Endozoicomonas TaxID=2644528 RepID=UPI0021494B69|nr:hypothetical protein [Endozoicomonas sp. ISHI1]
MQRTHLLAKHLKASPGWHQSCIIALVIFGLIRMGSVNLSRIAQTMGHGNGIDSGRKRLKRFFAWKFKINIMMVANQEVVIPAKELPHRPTGSFDLIQIQKAADRETLNGEKNDKNRVRTGLSPALHPCRVALPINHDTSTEIATNPFMFHPVGLAH